ncbi:TIGR02391 family protein [Leptospira noguchii]|uniref:TIGR02391 family protein n=1 Tax=Leptospira noguchii TaxID=28182 RepID=UPI000773AD03|nr:TIGR02391 family protein [Leptospira noguchii]UOG32656.1 TIGR02391 family protein [Leptospira noguchii]UOG36255.1 TIGR02391 family protein [Leptospira noguchii]UOG47219.1 TIGR02391 family protein [Leptospira noguchii]UOG50934.1 TIGR02391 family protein [Leptospira noguchii]UOG62574.1 TIGR02391 family protein [Leptospira noguchii]
MSQDKLRIFKPGQIEMLSKILGDTNFGLTGAEISRFLAQSNIRDTDPGMTKWKRLYNALVTAHNERKSGNHILSFISKALEPARFAGDLYYYHSIINEVNIILSFHGLEFRDDGKFYNIDKTNTLTEAERRASNLKSGIKERNLHPELINYCRKELLSDNYFHATFEATKGVADLIRKKSGINKDGSELVDKVFCGNEPILKINNYTSETEKSEQKGFANLLKGMFGTFRNPLAHEPKMSWNMSRDDALDLFTLASYILRRIDRT